MVQRYILNIFFTLLVLARRLEWFIKKKVGVRWFSHHYLLSYDLYYCLFKAIVLFLGFWFIACPQKMNSLSGNKLRYFKL